MAADVNANDFCVLWCGYHDYYLKKVHNKHERIDFAVIANPKLLCPGACAPGNPIISPNGDVGIDAMINVMAHELAETVTDPALNAYITQVNTGNEVG